MQSRTLRIRSGSIALAAAGLLFLLYPLLRPWHDESTVDGALLAMTAGAWIAAHLFAMIGFVLVGLGLLALHALVRHTAAEPLAGAALLTTWIAAGLVLPYYGAETFGLHSVAVAAAVGDIPLLEIVNGIRFHPVAITTFGLGLVALAVGAVLAALAMRRSGVLPRNAGMLFALGFVLFLPQFFTPAAVRIAHGVLVALGCVVAALALWRAARTNGTVAGDQQGADLGDSGAAGR